jgi:hypothetical protein
MAKITISDDERERRRQHMLRLHAEGRAGAEYGKLGGRPRKKRSSELVAEKAAQEADFIWSKLREKVDSENEKVSLDAIKHIHSIEDQERKIEVEEEVRYEQLKSNELREIVLGNFLALIADGRIDLEEIIDGEAFEDEERRAIEPGEID